MIGRDLEEGIRLLDRQRHDRTGLRLRHLNQCRSVDWDELQPLGLGKRRPERRVCESDPPPGAVLPLVSCEPSLHRERR